MKPIKEICVSCVLAGIGMICAGTYLDWIKTKYPMDFDPRLLAIVPPLIGLKGNLEVTLSSRLSTVMNLKMNVKMQLLKVFLTTLAYILIQAIAASSIISLICISIFPDSDDFWGHLRHTKRLVSVSTLTCCLSICCLSSVVFVLVLCCEALSKDPDNIAPPTAAALGDFATVTLLLNVNYLYTSSPIISSCAAMFLASVAFVASAVYLRRQNHTAIPLEDHHLTITWHTLRSSFVPLSSAILMSSLSGQVLAHFAHRLPNLARFQIAINGVGGCFGSVVISRMITRLHGKEKKVISPPSGRKQSDATSSTDTDSSQPHQHVSVFEVPKRSSCLSVHASHVVQNSLQTAPAVEEDADGVSRLILWTCMPIHLGLAFVSICLHRWLSLDESSLHLQSVLSPGTLVAYLLAGFMQIFIILKFAKWVVLRYWRYLLLQPRSKGSSTDVSDTVSLAPLDLAAVAFTTGLGDLIGSLCLVTTLLLFQS